MLDELFNNQVLMTCVIAGIWIVPGILFVSATNKKYRHRKKARQLKKYLGYTHNPKLAKI